MARLPLERILDANGDPVSGGRAYIFEAGTTNAVTPYSDTGLTTPHGAFVSSNSAGEWPDTYVAAGSYKIRYADADQAALYEQDFVAVGEWPSYTFFNGTAEDLAAAVAAGPTFIKQEMSLTLTAAQTQTILANIKNLLPEVELTLTLPGEEIAIADQVQFSAPQHRNLRILGQNVTETSVTAIASASGGARSHTVTYTLADASNVAPGDILMVGTQMTGTDHYKAAAGAWEVTAVNGNDVSVTHTLDAAWPTMTVTGGRVDIIKTILRFDGTRGFAVESGLKELSFIALAGQYDPAVTARADGPEDGLQVGTAADTVTTGANESQSQPGATLYGSRLAVIRWPNNGVEVKGGTCNIVTLHSCSNGWRGIQSAHGGSIICKFSSASGNHNGFQSEDNGVLTTTVAVAAGNAEEGLYSIRGMMTAPTSYACWNNVGIDARDGALVSAPASTVTDNAAKDVQTTAGTIIVQQGAVVGEVTAVEAGIINANGATSVAGYTFDFDSDAVYIDPDGRRQPRRDWQSFTPTFVNVTYTDDGSMGEYCQNGKIVHFKIIMDYTGLDTADASPVLISGLPINPTDRLGGLTLSILTSTGLSFAATDTFSAQWSDLVNSVGLVNSAGTFLQYNSTPVQASGIIEIAGWYEVA